MGAEGRGQSVTAAPCGWRTSFGILSALVLNACASNPNPPGLMPAADPDPSIAAVKAEREAATKAWMSCLMQAAKRLDDRKSDPVTIAQAVSSACSVEFDRQVAVYRVGDATLEDTARALRERTQGTAIAAVLQSRNQAP